MFWQTPRGQIEGRSKMNTQQKLTIVPCSRARASAFVDSYHRHHEARKICVFCLAVADQTGAVRGVAMVGTPVERMACDGHTLEVNRVATDGCPNACSALYGAAWRVAKALGYSRLLTYTLPTESGASLRGSGWALEGLTGGGSWKTHPRPGSDNHPTCQKLRWSKSTRGTAVVPVWPEADATRQAALFGQR